MTWCSISVRSENSCTSICISSKFNHMTCLTWNTEERTGYLWISNWLPWRIKKKERERDRIQYILFIWRREARTGERNAQSNLPEFWSPPKLQTEPSKLRVIENEGTEV
jgi:hypothetical protein